MIIILLLLLAFVISKINKETILIAVPVVFTGFSLVAMVIMIAFHLSSGSIRLLAAWEKASTFILFPHISGSELIVKNLFLSVFFLPLIEAICGRKDYKRLIIALVTCGIMLLAASDNELMSMKPYYTNGVMFGAAIIYLILYFERRRRFYLLGFGTLVIGCFLENRIGIISTMTFIVAFIIVSVTCFIFRRAELNQKPDWWIYIIATIFAIAAIYAFRVFAIGDNPFRKDVFNTYIGAVFTAYRYSVIPFINLSYGYFVIIMLLFMVFCINSSNRDINGMLNMTLCIWNIVFALVLSFLYMTAYAAENLANYDEYLTFFADYIQCPVIVMMYYFGFSYARLDYKGGMNK